MSKETLGRVIGDAVYLPICNRCDRYAVWGRCASYPEQIPRAILAGYAGCSDYAPSGG